MSLSDDILTILFSYSAGYKRMRQLLFSPTYPRLRKRSEIKQEVLYTTLGRLKRNGLVTKKDNNWTMTKKGKEYFHKRIKSLLPFHSPPLEIKKNLKKNMVVAFDIPEKYREKRKWLRAELTLLGFLPIQKSVWFGPAPLPKDFIIKLNELDILQYLKFFKAEEKDIV